MSPFAAHNPLMAADRHQTKPYPLRISDDLRERLENVAKASGRSLNQEIAMRLERSFATGMRDAEVTAPTAQVATDEFQIEEVMGRVLEKMMQRYGIGSAQPKRKPQDPTAPAPAKPKKGK